MHQTVANVLRTTIMLAPPQNLLQAQQLLDDALATTMYATWHKLLSLVLWEPHLVV